MSRTGLRGLAAIVMTTVLAMQVGVAFASGKVTQRSIDDAFVDTFFLEGVAPIRAQMPFNVDDQTGANLLAALRVDSLDAVRGGGPYASVEEMFLAFYSNQETFNNDPSRNRIRMHGSIREMIEPDGTIVVELTIAYQDLPLTVYSLDSWDTSLEQLDPAQAMVVLEDGSLNGRLHLEMEISEPGAELHFWNAFFSGQIRALSFAGHGSGWLVDESGARIGRAAVKVSVPNLVDPNVVRIKPLGSG